MGRLIDADALKERIRSFLGIKSLDDLLPEEKAIVQHIDRMPTVDAVPVVRCKDCEWWTKQDKSLQGRCSRYGTYPTGEWFCAAGRKDEKVNGNETD